MHIRNVCVSMTRALYLDILINNLNVRDVEFINIIILKRIEP